MATKRSLSEGDAADNDDLPNNKRQRNNNEEAQLLPSFSNLPSDCKVHILTNLGLEDMNNFGECSRDCRQVRAHESLDQERTGTLVWTEDTSSLSFLSKLWNVRDKFTGNRIQLKFVDRATRSTNERRSEMIVPVSDIICRLTPDWLNCLPEVMKLACSSIQGRGSINQLNVLSLALPNLLELDLSGFTPRYNRDIIASTFARFPLLTKLTWPESRWNLYDGNELRECNNLTQVYLDDCKFNISVVHFLGVILPDQQQNDYLMVKCQRLQRLSVKGTTVQEFGDSRPLPKDALIKTVRRHPTLRWLRSDLTVDNVAMLKEERPEITFVSG